MCSSSIRHFFACAFANGTKLSLIFKGKAILARQAFDSVKNDHDESESGRTGSLWDIVRNNLHIVNEITPSETFDSGPI